MTTDSLNADIQRYDIGRINDRPAVEHSTLNGGEQWLVRFANGYGASIINDGYGRDRSLYELAVLKLDGVSDPIVYDTEITKNVVGWLDRAGVLAGLQLVGDLEDGS